MYQVNIIPNCALENITTSMSSSGQDVSLTHSRSWVQSPPSIFLFLQARAGLDYFLHFLPFGHLNLSDADDAFQFLVFSLRGHSTEYWNIGYWIPKPPYTLVWFTWFTVWFRILDIGFKSAWDIGYWFQIVSGYWISVFESL